MKMKKTHLVCSCFCYGFSPLGDKKINVILSRSQSELRTREKNWQYSKELSAIDNITKQCNICVLKINTQVIAI